MKHIDKMKKGYAVFDYWDCPVCKFKEKKDAESLCNKDESLCRVLPVWMTDDEYDKAN